MTWSATFFPKPRRFVLPEPEFIVGSFRAVLSPRG
jgi:hypothetical protein